MFSGFLFFLWNSKIVKETKEMNLILRFVEHNLIEQPLNMRDQKQLIES
jgi:hypothetical protein